MTTDILAVSAAQDLSRHIGPDRVLAPGPAYDEALQIWNGAIASRPALIVRCETPAEVQATVLAARRRDLPLSVRGGGHDWAGRALRSGGLVIDLTRMRRVAVNAGSQTATFAGGATARDVITETAPYGLAAATGTVGSVGMAGLTLGGG